MHLTIILWYPSPTSLEGAVVQKNIVWEEAHFFIKTLEIGFSL